MKVKQSLWAFGVFMVCCLLVTLFKVWTQENRIILNPLIWCAIFFSPWVLSRWVFRFTAPPKTDGEGVKS